MKYSVVILLLIALALMGQVSPQAEPDPVVSRMSESEWVDSVFSRMTIEQQLGQLIMAPAYSRPESKDKDYLLRLIRDYQIGGVLFMQGEPERQANLAQAFQEASELPLLIAQDAEWGLNMRLNQTLAFPKNMTLGAIRDDSLLYFLGEEYARQLRSVGVQVNFAPVLDINNNPRNPVINYRSFGENRYNVARKGIMLSRGMQDHGVLACGKHFPGHGDTDTDSHLDLPVIGHSRARLDTLELYPFLKAMEGGIGALMVAHLYIPALDPTPQLASTLSPRVVGQLIRKELGYQGLVFTDALNMKGVTKYHAPGEVEVLAFQAGNDILLQPENVPLAISRLKEALENGQISARELESRVRRILNTKYRLGLERPAEPSRNLQGVLHSPEARILRKRLYEAALTLAKNDKQLLPLTQLEQLNIAYVQIGSNASTPFEQTLKKYGAVQDFRLSPTASEAERNALLEKLAGYNVVIVGLFDLSYQASRNFGVSQSTAAFTRALQTRGLPTVLTVFGSPYALKFFGEEQAILLAHEQVSEAQQAAAAAIFGGLSVDGRMPVSASSQFPEGTGLELKQVIRFGFGLPEENGMDSRPLQRIDSLAEHYIRQGAMPGCAILVARHNQIVYEKGFGRTQTEGKGVPIDPYYHTYDLASVTKVAVTTTLTMKLVEEGLLELDAPISKYLPELKGSNKARLTIRRLLQHNAGLPSWRPFYRDTYADPGHKTLDMRYYGFAPSDSHVVKIAPDLFSVPALQDSVWAWIRDMEVRNTTSVRYSDIGMILLGKILERSTGTTLERYASYRFFRSLGMSSTCFNPALKGLALRCPPGGVDNYWRNCTLQGYVHDETAAILGGQAGHAGLFSNVYDLAKLLFLYKNHGEYGGQRYFLPATIDYFTRQQLPNNRKGLGWDKPEIYPDKSNPVSAMSSAETFGHTGFTGTCVWVDPQYDLIFVFLSNRTYPWASNKMLLRENVRSQIMDQLYFSIQSFEEGRQGWVMGD